MWYTLSLSLLILYLCVDTIFILLHHSLDKKCERSALDVGLEMYSLVEHSLVFGVVGNHHLSFSLGWYRSAGVVNRYAPTR